MMRIGADNPIEKARIALEGGRIFTARRILRRLDAGFSSSDTDCEAWMMMALEVRELLEQADAANPWASMRERIRGIRRPKGVARKK